jgi:DNA topoisomerase-1
MIDYNNIENINDFEELWFIESYNKVQSFQKTLLKLGFKAKVYATKGHLFTMPSKLTPIGINDSYNEYMRVPKSEDFNNFLRNYVVDFKKIVIATNADQEGDVIAWDLYELLNDMNSNIIRVSLKGMDDESVLDSITNMKPVLKDDAIPGRTRSIIDRIIGGTFSNNGITVGRIGTAILGIVAQKKYTVWHLNLTAPAKDGGRPWIASTDIINPLDRDIADRLIDMQFPMLDVDNSYSKISKPYNMGEIMLRAVDKLDMSPYEVSKAMQRTYEAGRLSYPTSSSRSISKLALRRIKKMMENSGYKYDENNILNNKEEIYDAPYPIGDVSINLNPEKMGQDEGVRTFIARSLVKTGQKHTIESPITIPLEEFLLNNNFSNEVAKYISQLDWHREIGPKYPDQENWRPSEIIQRRPDGVLLKAMIELGLGSPSTWGNHIEGFIKRDLVDEELNLTTKGKLWLQNSPKELIDPRIAIAIEKACKKLGSGLFVENREPWEVLAEKIINVLPIQIRNQINENLEATQKILKNN